MEQYNFQLNSRKEVELPEVGFTLYPISDITAKNQPDSETRFPGDMILQAQLPDDSYLFLIDPTNDPKFDKWSMHLFYEAVRYYCQVVLDQEPQVIYKIFGAAFYPYSM